MHHFTKKSTSQNHYTVFAKDFLEPSNSNNRKIPQKGLQLKTDEKWRISRCLTKFLTKFALSDERENGIFGGKMLWSLIN